MTTTEVEITPWKIVKYIFLAFLVIAILIITFSSMYIIGAGERGIVLEWGNPRQVAMSEGLHFKMPIRDEVVKMDIKTQKYEADASSASRDLQIVSTKIAVNFHLNPDMTPELYKTIGISYGERVIQPAVQEVVKASTAQFTAEELITRRADAKDKILDGLKERLSSRGVIVEDISITDFDFSAEFNRAIEAKVTAEQNALAEKNRLSQIEYQAQQRVAQAEGEAKAIKAQLDAIKAQGGSEYVKLQAIGKWDGKLPTVMLGDGATPFISLGNYT